MAALVRHDSRGSRVQLFLFLLMDVTLQVQLILSSDENSLSCVSTVCYQGEVGCML